ASTTSTCTCSPGADSAGLRAERAPGGGRPPAAQGCGRSAPRSRLWLGVMRLHRLVDDDRPAPVRAAPVRVVPAGPEAVEPGIVVGRVHIQRPLPPQVYRVGLDHRIGVVEIADAAVFGAADAAGYRDLAAALEQLGVLEPFLAGDETAAR